MDPNEFVEIVATSMTKLHRAFIALQEENPEGHLKIERQGMDLIVTVAKVGPYKFTLDQHS